MGFLNVLRPDRSGEAVVGAVGSLDDFIDTFKRQDAHDRAEDFIARDRHFIANVGKDRRLDEVAFVADSAAAGEAGCSFGLSFIDVAQNLIELIGIDLRALSRLRVERVADLTQLRAGDDLLDELVVNRLLNEQSRAGAAALTLIEEQTELGPGDSRVEVRVGEDDVRAFAAEFKRQPLQRSGRINHDFLRGFVVAGERDLVHTWMPHDRGAGRSEAGHNVDDTIGNTRLLSEFRQTQTAQRRLLSGLHDDRAASGKSRSPLPSSHQQRKIPRNDLPGDTDWLTARVAKIVAPNRDRVSSELVGPTGVITNAVDRER